VDVVDIDLLLVDGDNLLHTARGRRDDGGVSWLLPELARWRRDVMRVVVALDGHPPASRAADAQPAVWSTTTRARVPLTTCSSRSWVRSLSPDEPAASW
jgi:hypothetical protein